MYSSANQSTDHLLKILLETEFRQAITNPPEGSDSHGSRKEEELEKTISEFKNYKAERESWQTSQEYKPGFFKRRKQCRIPEFICPVQPQEIVDLTVESAPLSANLSSETISTPIFDYLIKQAVLYPQFVLSDALRNAALFADLYLTKNGISIFDTCSGKFNYSKKTGDKFETIFSNLYNLLKAKKISEEDAVSISRTFYQSKDTAEFKDHFAAALLFIGNCYEPEWVKELRIRYNTP